MGLTGLFQIVLPLTAPMVDIYLVYGLVFLDPVLTDDDRRAARCSLQLAPGAVAFRLEGEPIRALRLLPAAAAGLPPADVRGAHAVPRDRDRGVALHWQKIPRTGDFSGGSDHTRPAS